MSHPAAEIKVNGVVITPEHIHTEMQYHPAPAVFDARYQAIRALVVRELLQQQVAKLGVAHSIDTSEFLDECIDTLLKQEIATPEPTEAECQRYYHNNAKQFMTSPLFEVAHILYLAPEENPAARAAALVKAEAALLELRAEPQIFSALAQRDSACSSARDGGRLGQITRDQTLPEFEDAVFKMKEGDISAAPVATEVGYHLIRLDRRVDGGLLPFEAVASRIEAHLKTQSWQRAVSQYIQILAGEAEIVGFRLLGAETPLVQ